MRIWTLLLPFAVGACASSDFKGPTMPGYIDAPPPPIAAAGDAVLTGTLWSWQGTQMSDGTRHVPDAPERYTLLFDAGGKVNVRADCNRGSGTYALTGNALTFGPMALTRMACPPGSRDVEFLEGLQVVSGHLFRGDDLVLTLKSDSGSMRFTTSRQ